MNPPLAIALKVASTLVFTLMLACIKWVGDAVPPGEAVFFRSLFALIPIVAILAWQGALRASLRTERPWAHVGRGLVGVVAMALWFAAIPRLGLPEAMAITYAAPILTVVLAAFLLGEEVRIVRWAAVAIGFCGVLVILWPRLSVGEGGLAASLDDAQALGALCALLSAFAMAFAAIFIRRLTATETTGSIVLYFSTLAALASLASAPFGWTLPSAEAAAALVVAGLLGGVGQILLTHAYGHGEAATVAPFEYVSMVWGVGIGVLVFDEAPPAHVLAGGGIVIAAGLLILHRERRLGLKRAREAAPAQG